MKSVNVKYMGWIIVLSLVIGLLIYVPLSFYLPAEIASRIIKRDAKIAEYISQEIKEPLLTKNSLSLNLLLHDNLENLHDAEYIFIQDGEGNIVAHTFDGGFPEGLLGINQLDDSGSYRAKKIRAGGGEIYDLAVPIFSGSSYALHLGVSLQSGKREIAEFAKINYFVTGFIFVGLGISFLSLLMFGLREARKLSSLEERNRLAMELHDGLAQSLASVAIRLELCKKLFDSDFKKGMNELSKLKDDARKIVTETRDAISNLKSTGAGEGT
jgi:signal transduction histidine kinase